MTDVKEFWYIRMCDGQMDSNCLLLWRSAIREHEKKTKKNS